MLWDIFCRVIDNFGDIGVCWRLCAQLAQRGHSVRLWVDDPRALEWMAPGATGGEWPGISVHRWDEAEQPESLVTPAEVWVEAFGCNPPETFVAKRFTPAPGNEPPLAWINLEYLTAEPYAQQCHGLASPLQTGAAKGFQKQFFYPGFHATTGGLLREPGLLERRHAFSESDKLAWLHAMGCHWQGEPLVSLFCYEPAILAPMLQAWSLGRDTRTLLVTPGRAAACVQAALKIHPPHEQVQQHGRLQVVFLPCLTQPEFDLLLWSCDLNFVRGEDSLVRALWAGRAFVWHIYPQEDGAHVAKLEAFLNQIQAPPSLRQAHQAWNGLPDASRLGESRLLSLDELPSWRETTEKACAGLSQQTDLASQLLDFVRRIGMKSR